MKAAGGYPAALDAWLLKSLYQQTVSVWWPPQAAG